MKKFAALFAAFLIVSFVFGQASIQKAPVNPDYTRYLQDLQNGSVTTVTPDGHGLGYIPPVLKPDFSGFVAPPKSPHPSGCLRFANKRTHDFSKKTREVAAHAGHLPPWPPWSRDGSPWGTARMICRRTT